MRIYTHPRVAAPVLRRFIINTCHNFWQQIWISRNKNLFTDSALTTLSQNYSLFSFWNSLPNWFWTLPTLNPTSCLWVEESFYPKACTLPVISWFMELMVSFKNIFSWMFVQNALSGSLAHMCMLSWPTEEEINNGKSWDLWRCGKRLGHACTCLCKRWEGNPHWQ